MALRPFCRSRVTAGRLKVYVAAAAVAAIALFVGGAATAATTTVDCSADPAALTAALATASDGDTLTIVGTCAGTFEIAHNLTLTGSGGATLDGTGTGSVVLTIDAAKTVSVTGLTITGGGSSAPFPTHNGGIDNLGTLTLRDSAVRNNTTIGNGVGGIANSGTLTVVDGVISDNTASSGAGGGIGSGGTATLIRTTVSGNNAAFGGGIFAAGMFTLIDSTVTGNSTAHAFRPSGGGGILNVGTMTVTGSTISGNTASFGGGFDNNGSMTIDDSTISGNTTTFERGGGIANDRGSLTVRNSTISGNTSVRYGGGIVNGIFSVAGAVLDVESSTISGNGAPFGGGVVTDPTTSTTTTLRNTIVAGQTSGANCAGIFNGTVVDGGYNLEDGTSCGFNVANHSLPNTNPSLDPAGLKDNGGATNTIALMPGSAALDAIPPGANGCGTTITRDQRGVTRPEGAGCDIGAFELLVPNLTVTIDIRPGSLQNPVNPASRGTIPVAILSTASFDAPTEVDTTSLAFGRTGNEASLAFCSPPQDVNGDGLLDLLCHFSTPKTGFQSGDTQGLLTGKTVTGTPLRGTDSITVVPPP